MKSRRSILFSTLNTRSMICNGEKTKVYRSDTLDFCEKEDFELLLANNVATIIDIRNPNRKQKNTNKLIESFHFKYVNLQFGSYQEETLFCKNVRANTINKKIAYFMHLIDSYKDTVKEIIEIILSSKNNILIHCNLGRDRTGLICFLLGIFCESSKREAISEFALSDRYLKNMKNVYSDKRVSYIQLKKEITRVYKLFFKKYPSVESYFNAMNLSLDKLEELRKRIY